MEPMTYPLELLRAELKSAMAEQLVQLMDRFASKTEISDFRSEFAAHERKDDVRFDAIDHKLDLLLGEKDGRDAVKDDRRTSNAQRWVVIGICATVAAAVIGSAASVITFAFFS